MTHCGTRIDRWGLENSIKVTAQCAEKQSLPQENWPIFEGVQISKIFVFISQFSDLISWETETV